MIEVLPLNGLRVVELSHAVMGPACGLVLADLGAEVIRIEPPGGDPTRQLKGFGIGYFSFFNRNKKSVCIDLKSKIGCENLSRLLETTDILIENFAPGTLDKLGFSYDAVRQINQEIIYCSLKGFLSGPYENRHALDEVVQMMGGLAYMTGPHGNPLRAGTSVVDIMGGTFGSTAILAALYERTFTGTGKYIRSGLFESTAFLMGQHMACSVLSGKPVPPMPHRVSAWSVYRVFKSAQDKPIFIGLVSDKHWIRFCEEFQFADLLCNAKYKTNADRINERDILLPDLETRFQKLGFEEICNRCEKANIPFAPVARPEDLFTDPHLSQKWLLPTIFPDGTPTLMPSLPIEWNGEVLPCRLPPPQVGEHTNEILDSLK